MGTIFNRGEGKMEEHFGTEKQDLKKKMGGEENQLNGNFIHSCFYLFITRPVQQDPRSSSCVEDQRPIYPGIP